MIKKLFFLSIVIILLSLGYFIYLYSQIRFDLDKIVNYKPKLTTQFYDKNGVLLCNIFKKEHRLYVKYKDIPPMVIQALVAIEDTDYFEHSGVNINAIFRALIKDIKAMKMVEGASTLTQQLVKTMILTRDKKIIRKIKEIMLASRLETLLTKEKILERYLNHIYFGHGYYGIRTASLGYFHKELDQLSIKEISILVGLPRAPSFYDPTRNFKYSLIRANQVIHRMNKLGWINNQEFEENINNIPVIYNTTLSQNKAPYIIDSAIAELSKDISNLRTGGYKIHLTVDLEAQNIAKKALKYAYNKILERDKNKETDKSTTKTINGAMVTIENHTGKIITMVGGIDYKKSSFNRARQSLRQPGSSAKPFIYQTALDLGYSTASNLIDISRTYKYKSNKNISKKWQPQNYEHDYKGLISLRYALMHSRNLATINLANEIGIDVLYKELKRYGFKDIPYDLSLTLGSFGISLIDLSEKYTIFSNNGIKLKPYLIQSIEDSYSQKITFDKDEKYITSPAQTYLMTSILKDVVTKGTGRNARVNGLEIVGKTGTTNNNVDAWFCGYSPTLQTIVWFGNDDNKPMGRRETGGRTAAPAFKYFYERYLNIHPEIQREFIKPNDVFEHTFNNKEEIFTQISNIPFKQKDGSIKNQDINNSIVF
ncbi:MAG: PBP1A family penicillin-binding protein [Campylobacterota bacterium]|nr:PBP1A family penicillin-binding protein [Campylobacterota bacterium]